MRGLAALLLVASCHRDPSPAQARADCVALIHQPLRTLDRNAFWRTCGPLLPTACRPSTHGRLDRASLERLEAGCHAVAGGSGDAFAAALPLSITELDRMTIATALRSEIAPSALAVHVHADGVDIDGKRMSIDDAVAAVREHGGGAMVWGAQDSPDMARALEKALGDETYVLCTPDGSNCR